MDIGVSYSGSVSIDLVSQILVAGNEVYRAKLVTQSPMGNINLNADMPMNQPIEIRLSTQDHNIIQHPLTITSLVLDNFYMLKTLAFKGSNNYDASFVDHCKKSGIRVDAQSDNNCLFFTGSLSYYISRPLSGMIFGRHMTFSTPL